MTGLLEHKRSRDQQKTEDDAACPRRGKQSRRFASRFDALSFTRNGRQSGSGPIIANAICQSVYASGSRRKSQEGTKTALLKAHTLAQIAVWRDHPPAPAFAAGEGKQPYSRRSPV